MKHRTVVFDLSTLPGRLPGDLRPLYYACCYLVESRRYEYFDPRTEKDVLKLIARLKDATEVVSFNGESFDLPVLREHHGLKGRVPTKGRHTDLCVVLSEQGRGGSLNDAVSLNLGKQKLAINTLPHDPVERSHARKACQSDVRQTYRLWKLHREKKLRYP